MKSERPTRQAGRGCRCRRAARSRRYRRGLALVVTLTASACASDVFVRYPAPAQVVTESGAVLIRFTEPMRAVSVSVDGMLVAEDEHTERVHVEDVPTGTRRITIVGATPGRTASVERSETVTVVTGQEASILVAVPPRSLGHWIFSAALLLSYAVVIATSDHWSN